MRINNFRLHLIFRTLGLVILALALAFFLLTPGFYVMSFLTCVLLVGMTAEFIYYVDKTNRDLSSFLVAIQHDDFSTSFSQSSKGKSFQKVYHHLNQITHRFQQIRAEKASQYQYLQTIVESVDVGLLCLTPTGEIRLLNKALQEFIQTPWLQHVKSLDRIDAKLPELIQQLAHGERELVQIVREGALYNLAIQATEFKLREESFKLISVKNIRGELEAKELEAWQKLIRILTHEIMNSVTPVVSLTGTLQEMLMDEETLQDAETLQDTRDGLKAIEKRSKGLMHFTESYRDLTRLPTPNYQEIELQDLLNRIYILTRPKLDERNISYQLQLPEESILFMADPQLLEQVLINLIQNAADALANQQEGRILLSGSMSEAGKIQISVQDNGPGMPKSVQEKIFVPFFTTKEQGSGIGLSLSRQILHMHKGQLQVQSIPGEGSRFTLIV